MAEKGQEWTYVPQHGTSLFDDLVGGYEQFVRHG